MTITMKKYFAPCALLVSLVGCAAPPYPAYAIENDAEQVANVVVADGSLQDVVRIGEALVERTQGGELRVIIPVRNIDSESIQILAQISFLDSNRHSIGDTSNRQVKLIGAGSTVDLDWTSVKTEASDYVLRLSWNK
ncbi:MAG: hypothetical protein KDE27_18325 [Planctomycetes bacterium]|nr:hypothetical protein [Planctomycetota bacterium]